MNEKNAKSHMVIRCSFSIGHQTSSHSSFIPGWLVLLLQVKTQQPQNSVHGILFCDNYTFLHIIVSWSCVLAKILNYC